MRKFIQKYANAFKAPVNADGSVMIYPKMFDNFSMVEKSTAIKSNGTEENSELRLMAAKQFLSDVSVAPDNLASAIMLRFRGSNEKKETPLVSGLVKTAYNILVRSVNFGTEIKALKSAVDRDYNLSIAAAQKALAEARIDGIGKKTATEDYNKKAITAKNTANWNTFIINTKVKLNNAIVQQALLI
jgi:hypothetical protein